MTTATEAPARPGAPSRAEAGEGQPLYVFELPVRIVHWALFFSIAVLSVTGWWIGGATLPKGVAMGTVRAVHVVAGWVMIASMVARFIWFFTGNRYASWREWLPVSKKRFFLIFDVIKFYTGLRASYPKHGSGHNPVAGLTYTVVFGLLTVIALTGIALHGTGRAGDWHTLAAWPFAAVGLSLTHMRLIHHMGMWLIWGFVIHHIASALLVDNETRGNCLSSIFSGWRSRAEPEPEDD